MTPDTLTLSWKEVLQFLAAVGVFAAGLAAAVWKLRDWLAKDSKEWREALKAQWDEVAKELKALSQHSAETREHMASMKEAQGNTAQEVLRLRDEARAQAVALAEVRGSLTPRSGPRKAPRSVHAA